MNFNEYQAQALKTALYSKELPNVVYTTLGLSGEIGEVTEKIKKLYRDKDGVVDDVARDALCLELGDCLWYLSCLAHELGISFGDVAEKNLIKCADRMERGVTRGSGDSR